MWPPQPDSFKRMLGANPLDGDLDDSHAIKNGRLAKDASGCVIVNYNRVRSSPVRLNPRASSGSLSSSTVVGINNEQEASRSLAEVFSRIEECYCSTEVGCRTAVRLKDHNGGMMVRG